MNLYSELKRSASFVEGKDINKAELAARSAAGATSYMGAAANDVIKNASSRSVSSSSNRPLFQRQNTRYGLTSDENAVSDVLRISFEDCLDRFVEQFVAPLAAVLLVVLVSAHVHAERVCTLGNKTGNAAALVFLWATLAWLACKAHQQQQQQQRPR